MKRILKIAGNFLLKLLIGFVIFSLLAVLIYRFVDPPVTPLMAVRYFEMEKPRLNYEWRDGDQISDHFKLAVIAAEDQNFYSHNGFDFGAIEKALDEASDGKRLRGASTISQQVAKNVFLWPSRSWLRKGLEAYFTFLIELLWDKDRILEVYVNIVELGEGVYGAEAASEEYFKCEALKLTPSQAAIMASVLPNPRKLSVRYPSSYVYRRQNWILRQMRNLGSIDYLKEHSE